MEGSLLISLQISRGCFRPLSCCSAERWGWITDREQGGRGPPWWGSLVVWTGAGRPAGLGHGLRAKETQDRDRVSDPVIHSVGDC